MTKNVKIVLIGAGSVEFGLSSLQDAFTTKELWGNELVLVDIDETAVKRIYQAALRINEELGANYSISYTTDRKKALPKADYVITSIAVNRMEMWKLDFQIPKKYGIQHVLGENQGPGALFHTMRNIPIMLDICRDIEEICPEALLLNFTNPESRLCMAIHKFTNVKVIGLCHGIGMGMEYVGKMMDKNPEELEFKAWGLNHFTWIHEMRDRVTGEDLYPQFKEIEKNYDPDYQKLSRFLFHRFGLYPTIGDGHLGEFFPYAHEMVGTEGYDYDAFEEKREDMKNLIIKLGDPASSFDEKFLQPSGEQAFEIIKGITFNTNKLIDSANLLNNGYITNLPSQAVVEVPVVVSAQGVQGVGLGELDKGIAAMCTQQVQVQELAVEAGYYGSEELAMQALLIDPTVPSAEAAVNIFRELFELNKDYLPQFKNKNSVY